MKNKKHTEENPEVKNGCETTETSQTAETTQTPETTEEAAEQIVDGNGINVSKVC